MIDAARIAAAMGGEASGNRASFPTPGHKGKDRGSWATVDASAPDGFLVHCSNGGDPLAIKREIIEKLGGETSRRREHAVKLSAGQRIVQTWEWRKDRKLRFRTHRIEPGTGGDSKSFAYDHPDGAGGWKAGRGGDPVPYNHDELAAALSGAVVVMAEGERKADRLAEWGYVATSSRHWKKEFAPLLEGKTVVILPDNDAPGRETAEKVAKLCGGAKVVTLELPGLPDKGDILDWAGTREDFTQLVNEEISSLRPRMAAYQKGISAADLMKKQFEPVNYIVPGLIAEGATLFGGKPKIGKSWMAYDFALAIASGRPVFGSIAVDQGDVIYLALEDSERRLRSRLLKKGVAAPERLTLVTEWPGLDGDCIPELEAWADSVTKPALVIVDVLKMVRGAARGNESLYDADYRALTGLASFARARGIAVLVVHHVRKMDSEDPLESLSGTNGLTGAADTVMVLKREQGTERCLLYVRGRDVEESEKAVRFKPNNGTWELLGNADEVGKTDERQAILDVLREHGKPLSVREISDILGRNYDAIRMCLARMWKGNEVEKAGRGTYTCSLCSDVRSDAEPNNRTHRTGGMSSEVEQNAFPHDNPALEPVRPAHWHPPISAPGDDEEVEF